MKKLFQFIRPYWWCVILSAFASAGCALVDVAISDLLKDVINTVVNKSYFKIPQMLIIGIILIGVTCISNYLSIYLTERFGAHLLRDIRSHIVRYIAKLSPDYMERNEFGDMIGRMTGDLENIRGFMETSMKECLYVPIMIIIFSAYLISLNPIMYLCSIGPLIVLVPLSAKLISPIKFSQKEYVRTLSKTNNNIQEAYIGAETVKVYALEDTMYDRYEKKLNTSLKLAQKNDKMQYAVEPLSYMIMRLPIIVTLILGSYYSFQGKVNMGELVAYITLLKVFIDPLIRAYQLWVNSKSAMGSLERVFEIYNEHPEDDKYESLEQVAGVDDDYVYKLKDLIFEYSNQISTLNKINIAIKQGEKIAIVGKSGSGKSTLLKLLYRHYSYYEGSLKFNGREITKVSANDVRENIALVLQKAYLFPLSIMDNIKIGRADATFEEVVEAAKKANCHEFIMELPNQYETIMGENGAEFSGGQKQRICLARAIIKKAKILLLDEPTSALDDESERLINKSIEDITKNKCITVITIAHRLPSIKHYDHILVMENGKLIEAGKHEELMRKGERYAEYYKAFA